MSRKERVLKSLESDHQQVRGILERSHFILSSEIRGPVVNLQEYLNLLMKAEYYLEQAIEDVKKYENKSEV